MSDNSVKAMLWVVFLVAAFLVVSVLTGCSNRTESGQCKVIVWTVPPTVTTAPCEGSQK